MAKSLVSCFFDSRCIWSLTYQQSVFRWYRSNELYKSFTNKMAAKTSWHRYGTKLRQCHHMYTPIIESWEQQHSVVISADVDADELVSLSEAGSRLVAVWAERRVTELRKWSKSARQPTDCIWKTDKLRRRRLRRSTRPPTQALDRCLLPAGDRRRDEWRSQQFARAGA